MKTIQDVKSEIDKTAKCIKDLEDLPGKKNKTAAKKLRNHLAKLNHYVLFIETAPTEESCLRAKKKLITTINRITDEYKSMYGEKVYNSRQSKSFLKDRGVPKLKQQVAQIDYLLH